MLRPAARNLAVLAVYATISLLYFGLPLLAHPGRKLIGFAPLGVQKDPEIFVWSFAWWPHAIATWTNPFFTHEIYAPTGVNLVWTTSVPGLALLFSPITIAFGPDVAFNVAQLLLPALAAWTAYVLCRYLARSTWAGLVGGYLFGFSAYMLGHEFGGHVNLTGVFLLPLAALAIVRYVRRELNERGLTWRLALIVALQLSISTEVTLTLTLSLVLGLLLALAAFGAYRGRLLTALVPISLGYIAAGVLDAPLVIYALKGYVPGGFADPAFFSGDLLNFVVPTRLVQLGGSTFAHVSLHFPGNDNERDSYLGFPVILFVAWLSVRSWRLSSVRFLVGALLTSAVLTIGTALHIDGKRIVTFPWHFVANQPTLDNALPARFAVYASLASAVLVAIWIGSVRGRFLPRPVVVPLLMVAAMAPATTSVSWAAAPERWAFFTQAEYKQCIPRGETLAIFPYGRWGDSMLWQAESGFWFRIAEGDMGRHNYPPNFVFAPVVSQLIFNFQRTRPNMVQLTAVARSHDVDRFVSVETHAYPDGTMMHSFGAVQLQDGVLISPACGHASLTGDTRLLGRGSPNLGGATVIELLERALAELHGTPSPAALHRARSNVALAAQLDTSSDDLAAANTALRRATNLADLHKPTGQVAAAARAALPLVTGYLATIEKGTADG